MACQEPRVVSGQDHRGFLSSFCAGREEKQDCPKPV